MKHGTSLFGQVLSIISRTKFAELARQHEADRHSKGFTTWTQFVSMMFLHHMKAPSLRDICQGLKSYGEKLCHLGLSEAPKKSTLSYANANRPWELYEDLFYETLNSCRDAFPGKKGKFRFKNKLLSLDATIIDLCQSMYDWAKYRTSKGAVKLHLLLDHDGYLPVFARITEGREHEIHTAKALELPEDSIVAFDAAYVDFRLFEKWSQAGVWFVTRMKDGIKYTVEEDREIPQKRNILSDQVIRLSSDHGRDACPRLLRRVVAWDEENGRRVVLLTNHLDFGATTISDIYKERWAIETFFRTLKQELKVKTFVGTSANALRIQIWTALIALVLLKYMAFKSKRGWAMCRLVTLLRWNLLTYKDLWAWLDDPFNRTPDPGDVRQLSLGFGQHSP